MFFQGTRKRRVARNQRATLHAPRATLNAHCPIREFERRVGDQQPNTKSIDRTN